MQFIICAISDNSVVQFVVVTLIFVFVLAITYFTTRFIGSYQKKTMSHGSIKVIESMRVNNSKVLEIVKAGDKCFLIAVCKDTITLIGEVNEETLELESEKDGASFGSVFSRFKVMQKNNDADDSEDEE